MATYPYWIEHDENGNPINNLWIKVDSIPAGGDKVIYISKGDGAPDGDGVFNFFDDFDGTSLDTSKWSLSGTVTLDMSIVEIPDGSGFYSMQTFLPAYVIAARSKVTDYRSTYLHLANDWAGFTTQTDVISTVVTATDWIFQTESTNIYTITIVGTPTLNIFGIHTFYVTSTQVDYYYNGVLQVTHTSNIPTVALPIRFNDWGGEGGYVYVDWVYVRKYTSNEPTVTVEQVDVDTVKVTIHNNETTDLTDYQVAIPLSSLPDGFITSSTESLTVSDLPYVILPYWVEHDENGNPLNNVWVKGNWIGTKEFYVYYNPVGNDESSITDGLVAWYKLDGTATDYSGNGNDGTIYGAVATTDRFERSNQALYFDGVDDYIETPTPNPGGGEFTVCAWIKTTDTYGRIVAFDSDISSSGIAGNWGLQIADGYPLFFYRGASQLVLIGNKLVNDGSWHFVCAVRNPTTGIRKIFVDGVLDAVITSGDTFVDSPTNSPITIGGETSNSYESLSYASNIYFNGSIDEVRIYNRALSDEEIKQLYQETSLKFSNGDAVFEFFDDFDGVSLDINKWSSSGTVTVSNSEVVISDSDGLTSTYSEIVSTQTFSDMTLEFKAKLVERYTHVGFFDSATLEFAMFSLHDKDLDGITDFIARVNDGTTESYLVLSPVDINYHKFTIKYLSSTKSEFYVDDTLEATLTTNVPASSLPLLFRTNYVNVGSSPLTLTIDWIFVHKYADPEPTITYGSEEVGSWEIGGYTYTKRKKVTVTSLIDLTDYQIALDYSQFNDDKLLVVEGEIGEEKKNRGLWNGFVS